MISLGLGRILGADADVRHQEAQYSLGFRPEQGTRRSHGVDGDCAGDDGGGKFPAHTSALVEGELAPDGDSLLSTVR